ncbi:MAG: LURP-one-related family protein [Anaerolineae bacterium]
MRYQVREKLLAIGDDFNIKDENGLDVLFVDGKVFRLTDTLEIKDMHGHVLVEIRRKLIALRPSYEIWRDGKQAAVVSKAFIHFFGDKFKVDVPGPDDYEIHGDIFSHEYTFHRHDQAVAQVSKSWFSLTDSYGVEIHEGEDAILILASAIVIDRISFENRDHERDLGVHR